MFIQNTNYTNQVANPDIRVSNVVPKVIAGASPQIAPQLQPSPEQLKSTVEAINKAMYQSNLSLELSVDANTKHPVVRMMDKETGELIRQFPSESVLAISHEIDRFQRGMLLHQKA